MPTFRLKQGHGEHYLKSGKVLRPGDVFEAAAPMDKLHSKFERLSSDTSDHPTWGKNVTDQFEQASGLEGVSVFQKGRRFRITQNGKIQSTNPARLTTVSEVESVLLSMAAKKANEDEMDNSELDDDDNEETDTVTDDDNENDESDSDEDSEDDDESDDDGIVGNEKKKKKNKKSKKS